MDPAEAGTKIQQSRYALDYEMPPDYIRNLRNKHVDCAWKKHKRDVVSVSMAVRSAGLTAGAGLTCSLNVAASDS